MLSINVHGLKFDPYDVCCLQCVQYMCVVCNAITTCVLLLFRTWSVNVCCLNVFSACVWFPRQSVHVCCLQRDQLEHKFVVYICDGWNVCDQWMWVVCNVINKITCVLFKCVHYSFVNNMIITCVLLPKGNQYMCVVSKETSTCVFLQGVQYMCVVYNFARQTSQK